MSEVNFDKFKRYIEGKYDDVLIQNKEIRIHSIFAPDDTGHHLWLSPSGGKKKRKNGVFHCFKTDRKGSLLSLIQIIENCDKEDAYLILKGQPTIRDLEKRLEEFFAEEDKKVEEEIPEVNIELPSGCVLISDAKKWWGDKATEYLNKRKIPIDGLYICTESPYKGRIIIPYYDKNNKLIYFNGRSIFPEAKMRYKGPPKEIGVGKGDVVYFPEYPPKGELLHLCEGEFNAKSLHLSELYSAACGGKNMTEKQALILSNYSICLCLDRDKAGKAGTSVMSNAVSMIESATKTKDKLFVVRPPEPYKDWNEMYIQEGPTMVHHYIKKCAKPLTYHFPQGMGSAWTNFVDF